MHQTAHSLYIIYMFVMMVIDFDCHERTSTLQLLLSACLQCIQRGSVKKKKKSVLCRAPFPVYSECGSFFSGHRSFVYPFIPLSVSLHLYSLPLFLLVAHWCCQLQANSSRWHSIVQTGPGVVFVSVFSYVMQCAEAWHSKDEAD